MISDKKRDSFSSNELDYSKDTAEEIEFSEEFLRAQRVKAPLRKKQLKNIKKRKLKHRHHRNKNYKKNTIFHVEKKNKHQIQLRKRIKQGKDNILVAKDLNEIL